MAVYSDALFDRNFQLFSRVFADRLDEIDLERVRALRDGGGLVPERPGWKPDPEHLILPPQLMPATTAGASALAESNQAFELGGGIYQYLDVPLSDPHVVHPLLKLREAVEEAGFDPAQQYTTTDCIRPHFLVALGAGDGVELARLIQTYQPVHLFVAVPEWNAFLSSFWVLDWQDLWNQFDRNPSRRISVGRYETASSIISALMSSCVGGLEHSLVYTPPDASEETCAIRRDVCSRYAVHGVNYLGFTIDEHNMVWQAWQSLQRRPRMFAQPFSKPGGRYVVVGSGPSLDQALPVIRELQATHQILACGSNYSTLRAAGIRVDVLLILERGEYFSENYINDYRPTVDRYGAGDTVLMCSVTSPAGFHALFRDATVFFRPALTPLALFANSHNEILPFEGPQTVNTGVALAAACGAEEVVLFGVDLATRDLDRPRSAGANGFTPREFNYQAPGNFGGTVYTERELLDTQLAMELTLRCHESMKVFNASDGMAIAGAEPIRPEAYLERAALWQGDGGRVAFRSWWDGLPRYSPERFQASWRSRRPRQAVARNFAALRELFAGPTPWFPDLLWRCTELLALDVAPADQFPRRVIRAAIHKLTLTISRQLMVMGRDPQAQERFGAKARAIMVDLLDQMERECYQLCDELEKLPQAPIGAEVRSLESPVP